MIGEPITLREYQNDAVNAFFEGVSGGCMSGIIAAPTGSGKSLIIADICKKMISYWPHTRIIVATHKKELIVQNQIEFNRYIPGMPSGIYSAGLSQRNTKNQVLFVGIQSVYSKAHDFCKIDLLIIDEAHLVNHEDGTSYAKFISDLKISNPNIVIVGMSATPYRLDNGLLYEGKNRLFDCLYYDIGLARLIEEGYLSPVISKGGTTKIDLSEVKITAGEYNRKSLSLAANQSAITESAVAEIIKYGKDRNAWLIFTSGIEHANSVCNELLRNGISCEVITSELNDEDRQDYLDAFKERRIQCLVNVEILVAGFNAPEIDLIALLMATKSTSKYVQCVGRGTRMCDGKENCLLLDYGENVVRHGMIDAVEPPQEKKKSETPGDAPCKECPDCLSIVFAAATICSECGYIFPAKAKHEPTAYSGAVLSKQEAPVWYTVSEVGVARHRKADKPDSVKMTFRVYETDKEYTEYLTLDHDNAYSPKKGRKLIAAMGGKATNVNDALKEMYEWTEPTRIQVKKNGKWWNIVAFDFPDDTSKQSKLF